MSSCLNWENKDFKLKRFILKVCIQNPSWFLVLTKSSHSFFEVMAYEVDPNLGGLERSGNKMLSEDPEFGKRSLK